MSISTNILLDALSTFKSFVQDNDVQVQTIQVFLKVANSSSSPSMEDLMKATGIGLSAVSRNLKKLAIGPLGQPGYGLITIELDPYDNRRRVLSLSRRGKELITLIEDSIRPHLQYLAKGISQ